MAKSLHLELHQFLRAAHVIVARQPHPRRCVWSRRAQQLILHTPENSVPGEALPYANSAHFHLPRGETQTLKCQPLAQPGTPGTRTWHTEKEGGKRNQNVTGFCLSTDTAQLSHKI